MQRAWGGVGRRDNQRTVGCDSTWRNRHGSAAIEYMLCTVVLALGGVGIWWAVGNGVDSTMKQVTASMGSPAAVSHDVAPGSSATSATSDSALAAKSPAGLSAPPMSNRARTALACAIVIATSLLASALLLAPHLRAARAARLAGGNGVTGELPTQLARDKLFVKRQQILNIFSRDMDALLEGRICVRHIMSKRMTTVEPNTPVSEIRKKMESANLHHILVCEGEKLVGIISDRDLRKTDVGTASKIMTSDIITAGLNSLISPAITLMIQRRVHCLPVTEDGKLRGVLTTSDFMMTLQCVLQMLSQVAAEVVPGEKPAGSSLPACDD